MQKKWFSLLSVLLLMGCGNEYEKETAEEVYLRAKSAFDNYNYDKAAELFRKVDKEHFDSQKWAPRAMIMEAYSHFLNSGDHHNFDTYDQAVAVLDAFIEIHSRHPLLAYAMYLKGMCYYVRVFDVHRHQDHTLRAVESFQALINRFPSSKYAVDAKKKLKFAHEHLAAKEVNTGMNYFKLGEYLAAINRLQPLLKSSEAKAYHGDILATLTKIYYELGLDDLADIMLKDLKTKYPQHEQLEDIEAGIAAIKTK